MYVHTDIKRKQSKSLWSIQGVSLKKCTQSAIRSTILERTEVSHQTKITKCTQIWRRLSGKGDSYLIKPEDSKTGMLLALSEVLAPFEFCLRSLEYNGGQGLKQIYNSKLSLHAGTRNHGYQLCHEAISEIRFCQCAE